MPKLVPEEWKTLLLRLSSNEPTLIKLVFDDDSLSDNAVKELIEVLIQNNNLTVLDLSNNFINNENAQNLCVLLESNRSLLQVNAKIENQLIIRSITDSLQRNQQLADQLHRAIQCDQLAMVKFLINAGVSLNARTSQGELILNLSDKNDNKTVFSYLAKKESARDLNLNANKDIFSILAGRVSTEVTLPQTVLTTLLKNTSNNINLSKVEESIDRQLKVNVIDNQTDRQQEHVVVQVENATRNETLIEKKNKSTHEQYTTGDNKVIKNIKLFWNSKPKSFTQLTKAMRDKVAEMDNKLTNPKYVTTSDREQLVNTTKNYIISIIKNLSISTDNFRNSGINEATSEGKKEEYSRPSVNEKAESRSLIKINSVENNETFLTVFLDSIAIRLLETNQLLGISNINILLEILLAFKEAGADFSLSNGFKAPIEYLLPLLISSQFFKQPPEFKVQVYKLFQKNNKTLFQTITKEENSAFAQLVSHPDNITQKWESDIGLLIRQGLDINLGKTRILTIVLNYLISNKLDQSTILSFLDKLEILLQLKANPFLEYKSNNCDFNKIAALWCNYQINYQIIDNYDQKKLLNNIIIEILDNIIDMENSEHFFVRNIQFRDFLCEEKGISFIKFVFSNSNKIERFQQVIKLFTMSIEEIPKLNKLKISALTEWQDANLTVISYGLKLGLRIKVYDALLSLFPEERSYLDQYISFSETDNFGNEINIFCQLLNLEESNILLIKSLQNQAVLELNEKAESANYIKNNIKDFCKEIPAISLVLKFKLSLEKAQLWAFCIIRIISYSKDEANAILLVLFEALAKAHTDNRFNMDEFNIKLVKKIFSYWPGLDKITKNKFLSDLALILNDEAIYSPDVDSELTMLIEKLDSLRPKHIISALEREIDNFINAKAISNIVKAATVEEINSIPEKGNTEKNTPLTYFIRQATPLGLENISIILQSFITAKTDFNKPDGNKFLPLQIAIKAKQWFLALELLKYGADETCDIQTDDNSNDGRARSTILDLICNEFFSAEDPSKNIEEEGFNALLASDSFINIIIIFFDRTRKIQNKHKDRIPILKQNLKRFSNDALTNLIIRINAHQSYINQKAKIDEDLATILIETNKVCLISRFIAVGTLQKKIPNMSKSWNMDPSLLTGLINIPQFYQDANIAIFNKTVFSFNKNTQLLIATIFLKALNNVPEFPLNTVQVSFFNWCKRLEERLGDNIATQGALVSLLNTFSANATQLDLISISDCFKSIASSKPLPTSKDFSLINLLDEILRTSPIKWVNQFQKLNDLIFHKSIKGLTLNEVQTYFNNESIKYKMKDCLPNNDVTLIFAQYDAVEKKVSEYIRDDQKCENLVQALQDNNNVIAVAAIIEFAILKALGKKPHHIQMITFLGLISGSVALKQNLLAQVGTGQGKSIIIAMTSAYFSIQGFTIDILTTIEALAARDAEEFAPFYKSLNITCDSNFRFEEAQVNYMTLSTAISRLSSNENQIFRDNNYSNYQRNEKKLVIVDEVDVLIVDRGTHAHLTFGYQLENFEKIFRLISEKFVTKAQEANLMKEVLEMNEFAHCGEPIKNYIKENFSDWCSSAMEAKEIILSNKYEIKDGKLAVVDKWTSHVSTTIILPNGLHQMLQIKLGIADIQAESLVGNVIAYEDFFKSNYQYILGLTGTIGTELERKFIYDIYKIKTFDVINYSGPAKLKINEPVICENDETWYERLEQTANILIKDRRPVLIIFETIAQVNKLNEKLKGRIDLLQVLTGKENTSEINKIVFHAGEVNTKCGMLTIATNIGGRGMDFKVDDPAVDKKGGMHVILSFYPENERIELQARGRTARQDKNGSCQFILNKLDCIKFIKKHNASVDTSKFTTVDSLLVTLNETRNKITQNLIQGNNYKKTKYEKLHKLCRKFFKDTLLLAKHPDIDELRLKWCLFLDYSSSNFNEKVIDERYKAIETIITAMLDKVEEQEDFVPRFN